MSDWATTSEHRRDLAELDRLRAENERLRALLNDEAYIRIKADYNRGHLSWANMIEERERDALDGEKA